MTDLNLRIDVDLAEGRTEVPSYSAEPSTPTTARNRARSLSQSVLPSFRISTSPNTEPHEVVTPTVKAFAPPTTNKARNESRKLLTHLLSQLQNRAMPPSALDMIVDGALGKAGSTNGKLSAAATYRGEMRRAMSQDLATQDDFDWEEHAVFSTDATLDLMNQLKDVLVISTKQKWDIFYEDPSQPDEDRSRLSDSLRHRKGSQGAKRRSRSRSRTRSDSGLDATSGADAPRLLSQCIAVLSSIISEDCRFRTAGPRPLKPPYALQAVTLDAALFLLHEHSHDAKIVAQIAFAVMPAFYTFRPSMYARLLAFFDDGVIGRALEDLSRIQGRQSVDQSYQATGTSAGGPLIPESAAPVGITVNVVDDPEGPAPVDAPWRRWPSRGIADYQSTNAPFQDISLYQLASLISPLLAAILENVDLLSTALPTTHRFHRLFSRIVACKPDTYNDLLGIVAYYSATARYSAVSLLMSYWPLAVGHLLVSRPFPQVTYAASMERAMLAPPSRQKPTHHPYAHQFVPWRFFSSSVPDIFAGSSQNECRACLNSITGFGLLCPFCMCAVHLDCYDYPHGSFSIEYYPSADPNLQKVAFVRCCYVLPQAPTSGSRAITIQGHSFFPINLFSLTLCLVCLNPLWGCHAQARRCSDCNILAHATCLDNVQPADLAVCGATSFDETRLTVSWLALRESFTNHYQDFLLPDVDMTRQSYEEVATFHGLLWMQREILRHGIHNGSILITTTGSKAPVATDAELREFELHHAINRYEGFLTSGKARVSPAIADYCEDNHVQPPLPGLLFNWNALSFVVGTLKVPHQESGISSSASDFLSAGIHDMASSSNELLYPVEAASLSQLRNQLGDQFQFHSESAARFVLAYLSHLGFFRVEGSIGTFDVAQPERQLCVFPLPLGFEVSTEVETLASAIEACLQDIDLSVNEAGLLLLTRRFWPDGMTTEYALRRLLKAVVRWIMSEDTSLAIMLRDYIAQGLSLPGVRAGSEQQPWPTSTEARPTGTSSASNGGDYVASRRALLSRHALRWMLAVHDRDLDEYATMIFDLLLEEAEDARENDVVLSSEKEDVLSAARSAETDAVLRHMIKLHQAGVLFTSYYDLFKKWLDLASEVRHDEDPIASLTRLFNREYDSSQRSGSIGDPRITMDPVGMIAPLNALNVLIDTARGSKEGFQRTLHSLCLLVRAGVDVSVPTFLQLVSLAKRFEVTAPECHLLVKAAMWSAWLRSLGRQDLQTVIAEIHAYLSRQIVDSLKTQAGRFETLAFIRQSLATCLLLYGCEREHLMEIDMVLKDEVSNLLSRRKISRSGGSSDPIIVNAGFMDALGCYIEAEEEEVSCLIAKFLHAFINEASLVETFEVDNFVLRNSQMLTTCLWQFYGVQRHEITTVRTSLLVRILAVDPQPLQAHLARTFSSVTSWETRLHAVTRLFRVILDTTSPHFSVEDRQWRSNVTDGFFYFFSSLWLDEREEVRLAVDTWSQSLLPAHFDAISNCWNESLAKSTVKEKIKLVSFLTQLHLHFPRWRALSWTAIVETLLENEFMLKNGDDEDGGAAAHLSMYGLSSDALNDTLEVVDPDLDLLRVSLLSLSLRMVADGVSIDLTSLLKLKDHLARVLGFQDVAMVSSPSGHGFYVRLGVLDRLPLSSDPCLNDLMLLLDSSRPFEFPPSAMGGAYADEDGASSLLVGSLFVDLVLEVTSHSEDIESVSPTSLKNLLKSLIIIVYKHDFESRPLLHLQNYLRRAMRRVLDLLSTNISYELRQMSLSACQAFLKRWPGVIGSFIYESLEAAATLMLKLHYDQNSDDIFVDQLRTFIDTTLNLYCQRGVLGTLWRRRLPAGFFEVLRHVLDATKPKSSRAASLRDAMKENLLREMIFPKVAENDFQGFQTAIGNVESFIDIVYHSGFSEGLMQHIGMRLVDIARQTAQWPADTFDPNPLLLIACSLVQHNKAQSRDLLTYLETILRAALVRFNITAATLQRIIQVTSTIYRRNVHNVPVIEVTNGNPIAYAMYELLLDSLRSKTRISAVTLSGLIAALDAPATGRAAGRPPPVSEEGYSRLADEGLRYLGADGMNGAPVTIDLATSQAIAMLILHVADRRPSIYGRVSIVPTLRAWNMLLIAALTADVDSAPSRLFECFPSFVSFYAQALYPYQNVQQPVDMEAQELAQKDLSGAYISLKLWLLLARKLDGRQDEMAHPVTSLSREVLLHLKVWNDLWPPYESVVSAFEEDGNGGYQSPLASTVWASVTDLITFLHHSRSAALDLSLETQTLNRLRRALREEAKIARVVRIMSEPPPEVPAEWFVKQVTTELQAEEKLQAAKRHETYPERGRRVFS